MTAAVSRVDQMLPGLAVGDATSNAAFLMRDRLRGLGVSSEIYAPRAHVMPAVRGQCREVVDYEGGRDDVLLHHYGLWSETAGLFMETAARKILVYHNITPGRYFRGYSDAMAHSLELSRERLPEVVARCERVWAVSKFNAEEVRALGGGDRVEVFPLPFQEEPVTEADPVVLQRLRAPAVTLLAVGRMAPNKCLEDLIRAFAWYHRTINPCSRLFLVGSDRSAPRYVTYLRLLCHALRVPNVCFEGFVWPQALKAYYCLADVYVSVSEHEGYCAPLLEAMAHGVPVISKRTGGTPEAMGSAGVQYSGLSARQLAELIHLVVGDPALRQRVMVSQERRMAEVRQRDIGSELSALLAPFKTCA